MLFFGFFCIFLGLLIIDFWLLNIVVVLINKVLLRNLNIGKWYLIVFKIKVWFVVIEFLLYLWIVLVLFRVKVL